MNSSLEPLFQQLITWQNLIVVLGCGSIMEIFKRGPITSEFAATRAGQALQYYAPVLWCAVMLFLPLRLAPENAGNGEKAMLAVVLGMATSSVYEWTVKAAKKVLESGDIPVPAAEKKVA